MSSSKVIILSLDNSTEEISLFSSLSAAEKFFRSLVDHPRDLRGRSQADGQANPPRLEFLKIGNFDENFLVQVKSKITDFKNMGYSPLELRGTWSKRGICGVIHTLRGNTFSDNKTDPALHQRRQREIETMLNRTTPGSAPAQLAAAAPAQGSLLAAPQPVAAHGALAEAAGLAEVASLAMATGADTRNPHPAGQHNEPTLEEEVTHANIGENDGDNLLRSLLNNDNEQSKEKDGAVGADQGRDLQQDADLQDLPENTSAGGSEANNGNVFDEPDNVEGNQGETAGEVALAQTRKHKSTEQSLLNIFSVFIIFLTGSFFGYFARVDQFGSTATPTAHPYNEVVSLSEPKYQQRWDKIVVELAACENKRVVLGMHVLLAQARGKKNENLQAKLADAEKRIEEKVHTIENLSKYVLLSKSHGKEINNLQGKLVEKEHDTENLRNESEKASTLAQTLVKKYENLQAKMMDAEKLMEEKEHAIEALNKNSLLAQACIMDTQRLQAELADTYEQIEEKENRIENPENNRLAGTLTAGILFVLCAFVTVWAHRKKSKQAINDTSNVALLSQLATLDMEIKNQEHRSMLEERTHYG